MGSTDRVRLCRDYYVMVLGNDYSVDPAEIGRFVDITASLTPVSVFCAGHVVAEHPRCWDTRRTITDPAHVIRAATRAYPPERLGDRDIDLGLLPVGMNTRR